MRPADIEIPCAGFIQVTQVLDIEGQVSLVFVSFEIPRTDAGRPSAIRVQGTPQDHIPFIIEHFIIPEAIQRQAQLFVGIESRRQYTRMPSLAERVDTKGQHHRYRHVFKLGVHRAGDGHLLIDEFDLLAYKSEVRRIEVAGGELATQRIKGIGIHFFDPLADHEYLPLLHIGALGKPLPRFHVEPDRIALRFEIGLVEFGKVDHVAVAVFDQVGFHQVGALIEFDTGRHQFIIEVIDTCFFSV